MRRDEAPPDAAAMAACRIRADRAGMADAVADYTADEVREALRPIASLLSKSEKAQRKLEPGTWQHTMLRDNIGALRIAYSLMAEGAVDSSPDELRGALGTIGSMIARTEKAGAKFAPGTSQHTLQRNRLEALRIAETLVGAELETAGSGDIEPID